MNSSEIEAFLAVVRSGNISKASKQLFISQSTISQRIKTLETKLDVRLIERSKGITSIKLSNEGEKFYKIALQWEQLMTDSKMLKQKQYVQNISIAGVDSIVNFVLNAESLNDIIGRIDVVTKLIGQNKQTIQRQEDDKALVETKETEAVGKQEEQMQLAAKLEENKALLEEQEAEQEAVLASLAAEKSVAQGERDVLIAQAQAAEARRAELQTIRTASSNTTAVTPASSNETASTSTSTPAATPATPAPAPAPAANNGSVIGIAHSLSGIPYSYGGTTVNGFDCSGFTSYVFRQAGRSLPRTAAGQYAGTSRVSRGEAQPGDLVFFNQGGGIDHVGIYLGGGNFIGSQYNGVVVSTINSGYWANYVVGFGR